MSLVANGINRTPSNINVNSGEFWPVVSLNRIRDEIRIDSSVTDPRLKSAVQYAVIHTNQQLMKIFGTKATLAEITDQVIDDESVAVVLYLQAVAAGAGAKLLERYRGFDSSAKEDKRSELQEPSIDEYRRDQQWAIRDILKLVDDQVHHVSVELI